MNTAFCKTSWGIIFKLLDEGKTFLFVLDTINETPISGYVIFKKIVIFHPTGAKGGGVCG